MYQVPTSYKTARTLVIKGVSVAKGTVLTAATVAGLRSLQSLLAKRWVIPTPDPTARRLKETRPMPTYASPGALRKFIDSAVLVAPTGLTATAGDTQVALAWTAPANGPEPDVTDYVVQYKAAASSTWLTFADGVATTTSATVTGLTNDTVYNFRVLAKNANGNSAASNVATATPVAA